MDDVILGSWTVRIAIGLAVLYGLLCLPQPGIIIMIFGMALAGPYGWGFLPHLITIGLILDVSSKRFSKQFLLVPVLGYAAYYVYFVHERIAIHSVEKQIQSQNSAQAIDFDPLRHALVLDSETNLVTVNKIPVTYEVNKNFSEGNLSRRLVSAQRCKDVRSVERDGQEFQVSGVFWERGGSLVPNSLSNVS